jgi:hypothetical protein
MLGTALMDQHSIQAGIQTRLASGNACYRTVQNILSSSLLSKNIRIKIFRTVILPVVFYGYQTWSLTLREKRRMRVFEKNMLMRTFGPTRDELTGDWRKLHNVELNDLYSSSNFYSGDQIEKNEMSGACSTYGEE